MKWTINRFVGFIPHLPKHLLCNEDWLMTVLDPWDTGLEVEVDPPVVGREPQVVLWEGTGGVGFRRIVRLVSPETDLLLTLKSDTVGNDLGVILPTGRHLILAFGGAGYWLDVRHLEKSKRIPLFPIIGASSCLELGLVAVHTFTCIAIFSDEGQVWSDRVMTDDLEILSFTPDGMKVKGTRYANAVLETLPLFPALGSTMD